MIIKKIVYCAIICICYMLLIFDKQKIEIATELEVSIDKKIMQVNKCEQRDYDSLPEAFQYKKNDKLPKVKSQGNLGTCWAFAALTALETSLLPEEKWDFSEDHLSKNHSFAIGQKEGGDYSMAMAYLAAWQGPVREKDDPYGDGKTNTSLKSVKHVQEMQIVTEKDYDEIKYMVYHYGGVQSSLYTSLEGVYSSSKYYNKEKAAYCYKGKKESNHDIVIVGWDDNYSKKNFNGKVKKNGAFICRNSWGKDFGKNGNFYVSYEDVNIGVHNVVYTIVEDKKNYDNIYQSDLCGWVGSLGYEKIENKYVYFSNVYKAKKEEELKAASFYATGADTEFQMYIVHDFENKDSLKNRELVAEGIVHNSGYYTIALEETVHLNKGEKYAIIIGIYTPGSTKPIAVEYKNDDITAGVSIRDGEGYFSADGIEWTSAEKNQKCNICLKAFTNNKKKSKNKVQK